MRERKDSNRAPLPEKKPVWDPSLHGPIYVVFDFFVPVESKEFMLFRFHPLRAYVSREIFQKLWQKPAEKR